jgi:hypothetical protein
MKYMCLIYTDPALTPAMGEKMNDAYFDLNRRMKAAGVMVAGDALQHVSTATSLRKRGEKVETMDGPFAETREQLGGYYIIDCPDLDQALQWAAQIPGAALGTVEVRPLVVFG